MRSFAVELFLAEWYNEMYLYCQNMLYWLESLAEDTPVAPAVTEFMGPLEGMMTEPPGAAAGAAETGTAPPGATRALTGAATAGGAPVGPTARRRQRLLAAAVGGIGLGSRQPHDLHEEGELLPVMGTAPPWKHP